VATPPRRAARKLRFEQFEPRLLLSTNFPAWSGVDQVRAEYGLTGVGQTVAVIDTGVAYRHAALGGGLGQGYRVAGGFDFAEQDADPYDDGPAGSHGTRVAGIVGSSDSAHSGVAPGVDLVALRVYDDSGAGSLSDVNSALQWVHAHRSDFRWPITTVNLSLGVGWNTDSPPDAAILESSLAQLKADGIFVAVAAGNGFAKCNQTGLDYPASSPAVVAAGAADSDGTLSSNSQRAARAIVAPGCGILTTVPDYAGNNNGRDDDFGGLSGTSTSSAFVAGAAVLLRQAYQVAGVQNVTEQTLYNIMLATADTIHDPVTGQDYHRLNLDRAVHSVLGDSKPAADPQPSAPTAIDWGTVTQQQFGGYQIGAAGQTFTVTASANGILTVEAISPQARSTMRLEVLDVAGHVLATGFPTSDGQRADVTAAAGAKFSVRTSLVDGSSATVAFRLTNLVTRSGQSVYVSGTSAADQFTFAAGTTLDVGINGVAYHFNRSDVGLVTFADRGGNDTAVLTGSSGADSAVLRPGSTELSGPGYRVLAAGVENVSINGGGGTDSAVFYDSTGDDTLTAGPGSAVLAGPGFSNEVRGFNRVQAISRAGGRDRAQSRGAAAGSGITATQLAALDFVLQLDGPWVRSNSRSRLGR
jgi:hypothetical protein